MSTEKYRLLSNIVNPSDLHKLTDAELQELSDEVRKAILDNVSKTGGHFSSNLGTVELTVALYATYCIPPDIVVWDTGHQAYPHKLLTGRLPRFGTLRQYKGLSPFLKREEHELDYFGAGHAGTAISAALGYAVARDQLKQNHRVVAVTGDAAICSGMSWEALNHGGDLGIKMTVVLNDNRMSIAPNVGAMTKHFAKLRSRPKLQNLATQAKDVVERMPSPVSRVAAGLRHGLTHYFAPEETGAIYEEMGWEYIGPVDGHDLPLLLDVFRNVRELNMPVFVHAITVKGKGYDVAEADARKWHGVVPFEVEKKEMVKAQGPISYTQAFGEAAIAVAEQDEKVVAITAAMPDGTGLTPFSKKFPDRYYDVGIAEQHAVTFAAGLAAGGIRPLCAIYSTFLQRGFDQVLHDVCLQNLPVRFFMDRAGLVGDDGPTHHGVFDVSYLRPIPNIVIASPRDTTELVEMVHFAAKYDQGPIAVRYPRGSGDESLPESRTPIELGKAERLLDGSDVTIVAFGSMVSPAWHAAKALREEGFSIGVINARWAKPIDQQMLLETVRNCKNMICIEENARPGGFGEAVQDLFVENKVPVNLKILTIPDYFVEHGAQPLIRRDVGLDKEGLIAACRELIGIKK
jgi:1-deoxy-D-xylulose-5-phosphate synthase